MFRLNCPILAALVLTTASLPAVAQTTGPAVTELVIERQVKLATALATKEIALPADMAQGITSGALEVRERFIYNPAGATLTSTLFTVQTGAPMPTPINANLSGAVLGVYTLNVEKVYSTLAPQNSVSFTGTVSASSNGGVLGNVTGLPFSVSMAYTNDTPAKVSDVVHVIAGRVVVYSADAFGTLTVPKPPAPPTPSAGPQIVIVAPGITVDYQITLDASKTTDDSGTSLTFAWKSLNKTSAILNPNTAVATVQFGEGMGLYSFELTVTNGKGVSAKQVVTVNYYGR